MRLDQTLILLPVLAQVLLTVAVLILMGRARGRDLARSRRSFQDVALATDADWGEAARKAANNYKNQFELPVLFYAVCLFALVTRSVDPWMMLLALLFVASRVAHTWIHLGTNVVLHRGIAFLAGLVVLLFMWLMVAWRTLGAGL